MQRRRPHVSMTSSLPPAPSCPSPRPTSPPPDLRSSSSRPSRGARCSSTTRPAAGGVGSEKEAMAEEDGGDDDYALLPWVEMGAGRWAPGVMLVEVLRRLPARGVAAAAGVCRGWRECARDVWRDAAEVSLCASGVGPVAAVVEQCPVLARLVLEMDSDVGATLLACIAFSCPNLQSLDIAMVNNSANRITGDKLSRFLSLQQSLAVLKLNGCSSLGFLNVSSSSLSTLHISGLCSLSKTVMNCPSLIELSLIFPEQNNDSTDLVALMDSLGRTCPNLRKMHISSIYLCNEAVFAIERANLRCLCMLSLYPGPQITDAAVASIVRSYTSLEYLDLSGSSITDNGLTMISNAFPNTLTRLQLAMCPNITSYGVRVAAEKLPLLRLMDCGKSICVISQPETRSAIFQKLTIKHNTLMKLNLWGCSAIDALYVNCPELVDLNLNSCTNLCPERLLIQCPKLKDGVHVEGCSDMVVGAIRNQIIQKL